MASAAGQPPPPGTCDGSSRASSPRRAPEEGDPALHLRMCKKIAQLTKVIYALNTKNDEHEASIQSLKEAHQEEIQHILAETKETVLHYKSKVEEEQALRQRIQALEEALEQRRQLKEEALTEFMTWKKREDESEPQTESECTEEKNVFHKELLHVKLDSENRVQTSNQESDSLLNERGPFDREILNIKGNLNEMQALIRELESVKRENQKLAEDSAKAASQLQAAHERDREAWRKAMQQSLADSCQEWQQKETEQRENFEAREVALQHQMKKLEADLETKGQRISELKKHSQKLREAVQNLELQLKEAQQVTMESKSAMKTLEEELIITKERLLIQENEILQKTGAIEMTLKSQSKTRTEAGDLKNPIPHFQQALSSEQNPGSKGLQPRGSASAEKEVIKLRHREELRKIKHESDEEKMCLKEQLVKGLEDLVKKHALELKAAQAAMDVDRKNVQKEAQAQLEELKKKHENEIGQLQREKDALCGKLQEEILRLEDFIRQNRDIPRCAEVLKSLTRKPFEKQQECQDASVQLKNASKQHKERTKGREQLLVPSSTRKEEKRSKMNAAAAASKSDSRSVPKREDERTPTNFPKEKEKEIQALQEEWSYQKAELQAQIAQLKQTSEQQASTFREALREQNRQASKEKEKLLQNLQDAIKQSQDTKVQLEASHQTAINLLEKSKNQELKEAEEQWKKESTESFKVQQESYRQEVQSLEQKARGALQSEVEKLQQQQSLLIESLRAELSEQRVSCIAHKKEKEELQEKLRNMMVLKRQQEGNNQDQIQSLKDELVKCQNEICGLKKENSLLKETVDLLSADAAVQKQTSLHLEEEGQHRRCKELEETPRKRESWPEDLRLISCLQEKLSEKEEMIKELLDGRKLHPSLLPSAEPHRHRSFSFNTNPSTCLAPTAKQKKKMDDAPSRIVSVPNLASYAKSFLSGDLRPKRNPPQITKSTSLDQNPGCVRVCYPPVQVLETKPGSRLQSNETAKPKEAQKKDPQHQEWFTKYFSF